MARVDLSSDDMHTDDHDKQLKIFSLIWLDTNLTESRDTERKLRCIINHVKKFQDVKQCLNFIEERSQKDRLVVIVNGKLGKEIVPYIHDYKHVISIYVYCADKKTNEQWSSKFSKIKAVLTELNELIFRIESDHRIQKKVEEPLAMSFFSTTSSLGTSTTGVNGQFVFSQILVDCLLRLKSHPADRNELVEHLKKQYQGNPDEMNNLREFEEGYSSSNALWWYTRESFFYKTLNTALRNQDIHMIFLFRSFISDIYHCLLDYQSKIPMQVYRSQMMPLNELKTLEKRIGQFISINSFFSTSLLQDRALSFFELSDNSSELQRVLFEINSDSKTISSKPFAEISSYSYFADELEVLFMLGSIFRLQNIHQDDQQLWIIRMTLCNDDEHDLKQVLNHMKQQVGNGETNLRVFGNILLRMGKFQLAEQYFHRFIKQLPPNDSLLIELYEDLGKLTSQNGDYDMSMHWHQRSLELKQHISSSERSTVCKSDENNRQSASHKKSITSEKSHRSSSSNLEHTHIVYIPDLPLNTDDDYKLEILIARRIEDLASMKPKKVKCYLKLGIGVIHVANNDLKDRLLNKIGKIALDPKRAKDFITIVETIELISYVVLNVTKELQDEQLPTAKEVSRRWLEKQHLHDAIAREIGESDLSTSLYVQINKHSGSACIISANVARLWSTKSFVIVDKITLQKKTKLACRLVLHPIPKSSSIQSIIKHREFRNAVIHHKLIGDHLILELSDEDVFEKCLDRGALRIDNGTVLTMVLGNTSNNSDGGEIDDDTWYEREMLEIKPDIMQFVANPKHKIFRYRWNSHLWNEQFERVKNQKRDPAHGTSHDPKKPTPDQIRHLLRVTVMLNTLGVIKKRSFMIEDREIQLNLKNELKTIVYNHESTLERTEKLNFTKTPYSRTTIRVVRNDCLHEYERMTKMGKRPVLLNMASATSPGGGFRKGDGAQEENIFRRSDYCRSLDIGLDDFLKEPRADRFHCTSESRLDRISDPNNMYPMNEYGAIYTTGITVFRQTEEKGYAFMENPLENVCSIAMAAYRDPELKGNFLAPQFAVGTRKKIENIFAIAHHHNHDCLILSALGCGAFKNPTEHVAKIFYSVIEQYAGFFDTIVFAIVDDYNAGRQLNPEGNYQPFATILDGQTVEPNTAMNKSNIIIGPYRLLSDGVTVANVTIFDRTPCKYGAKCREMYKHQHSNQFSHPPLCIQATINVKCKRTDDIVHTTSFIHRKQCRDGGLCHRINEENHPREFDHPDYCPDEGRCQKQNDEHLKQYRHLPLCEKAHKCMEYRKEVASHCSKFRHCAPRCPDRDILEMLCKKNRFEEFELPFASSCPQTPSDCLHFEELSGAIDIRSLSHNTPNHCMKYAHVYSSNEEQIFQKSQTAKMECKWRVDCRDHSIPHRTRYSHPSYTELYQSTTHCQVPCKWKALCYNYNSYHRAKYFHPS
ncbi:hypothetical protein I4U23_003663 [Adineta vaga]|nr:hypothetical protein I4U23_003663 [Adineta vaga]